MPPASEIARSAEAAYLLAQLRLRTGDEVGAARRFQKIVQDHPGTLHARRARANLILGIDDGRPVGAEELVDRQGLGAVAERGRGGVRVDVVDVADRQPAVLEGLGHAPLRPTAGGQRQMVAMGKALMLNPKILLLDEPTAGLSPKFRGEIFAIVQTINKAGTPILMVEQNAKQALRIANRGYVLVDGKNKFEGGGQALLDDPEVAEMFLGGGAEKSTS